MLEEVKKSLEASPIVKKGDYNYFVNPISDGVPAMDPKMLRELSLVVHKHADLDVDRLAALLQGRILFYGLRQKECRLQGIVR